MSPFRLSPLLLLALAAGARADYSFLVTQSPSGSNPGPYTNGVLRYNVNGAGVITAGTGISAGQVVDPVGLALSAGGELYVGNRNGNGNHPGGGSVSSFHYDAGTGAYVLDANLAAGATGTHGINVSATGELFAANVDGPVTRFQGTTASGTLNSGSARDVLLSPNGLFAYVTSGIDGNVQKFSTASGALLNTYSVAGASGLHFGAWRGSDLYIADFGSGRVYDLTFDGAGDIASAAQAVAVNASIGVGFSPDGNEMLVTGHTTNTISRFSRSGTGWVANGTIATGSNLGDIQVVAAPVPEPATLAVLGIGALGILRRRKR